jgi:hypothetical protein
MKGIEQRTVSIESTKGYSTIVTGTDDRIEQAAQSYAAKLGGKQKLLLFDLRGNCIQDNTFLRCWEFEDGGTYGEFHTIQWVINHPFDYLNTNTRLVPWLRETQPARLTEMQSVAQ